MRLSGPITSGDADRFHRALVEYFEDSPPERLDISGQAYWDARGEWFYHDRLLICLDSRGGSLDEALRMVDVFFDPSRYPLGPSDDRTSRNWNAILGTRIGPRMECSSACSIVFLAGSRLIFNVHAERVIDRSIHPDGRLGFHTPGLSVPVGNYTEAQVNQAFEAAMLSMGRLSQRSDHLHIPGSLLRAILAAGPSEMEYADTIEEITRWGIELYSLRGLEAVNHSHMMAVCENAGLAFDARPDWSSDSTWRTDETLIPRFRVPVGLPERREVHFEVNEQGALRAGTDLFVGFRIDHCEWAFTDDSVISETRYHPYDEAWRVVKPWHYFPRGMPITALSPRHGSTITMDDPLHTFTAHGVENCVEFVDLTITATTRCNIIVKWVMNGALDMTHHSVHLVAEGVPGLRLGILDSEDTPQPEEIPEVLLSQTDLIPSDVNQCLFDETGRTGYCRIVSR